MIDIALAGYADLEEWRAVARDLAVRAIAPAEIHWREASAPPALLDDPDWQARPQTVPGLRVPRSFLDLAGRVLCHRAAHRFDLLYRLLLGLQDTPALLGNPADPGVLDALALDKSVRRDIHKMHAFVRFRAIETPEGVQFLSWFVPEHRIVERAAGFFRDRFADQRWAIVTPERSVEWDGDSLAFGPGGDGAAWAVEDQWEDAWRTYYSHIFNPARLKEKAMLSEMPRKYWPAMPETALIPGLIAQARQRTHAMLEQETTAASPSTPAADLDAARAQAAQCTRCPLHQETTQTVFGSGPAAAPLMLVGEQPGDQEDRAGRPFVGPAGQLLDTALAEAGIARADTYVTNAVKHFRHELRGKFRLHKSPDASHIEACRWWLGQEIKAVQPTLIVALGATAARALLRRAVPIKASRGQLLATPTGETVLVTVHPSFRLRLPDPDSKALEFKLFVDDLRQAAAHLASRPSPRATPT